MKNPDIKQFIHEHKQLFWYTPEDKKVDISHDVLVETILNYGDLNAVRELIQLLGIDETARIFFNAIQVSTRRKNNFHELTVHFFSLFFKRYAHRDS